MSCGKSDSALFDFLRAEQDLLLTFGGRLVAVFNTMLGNSSLGYQAMDREEIIAPFEKAFDDPASGGCPRIEP